MPPTKVLIEQQQLQPTKIQQKNSITTKTGDKVLTRSQAWHFPTRVTAKDMSKRKADQLSPPKGKTTKRQLYDRGTNTTNIPAKPNNVTEKKTTQKKLVATVKQKEIKVTAVVQPKIPVYVDQKTSKGISKMSVAFWSKIAPLLLALKKAYQVPFLSSPQRQFLFFLDSPDGNETRNETPPGALTNRCMFQRSGLANLNFMENMEKTDQKLEFFRFATQAKGLSNKENIDINLKKQTRQVVAYLEQAEKIEAKFDCVQKVKSSTKFRRSLEANQESNESFYTTALEEVSPESDECSRIISPVKRSNEKKKMEEKAKEGSSPKVPPGVEDFDKENMLDPIQVSDYAMDIFNYMKKREKCFIVQDYMPRQVIISKWMRAVLVDWMVDIQENFELNHETLYLGVKITDIYLNKVVVAKEILQLIGATALLLAAKYEERMPPLIEDFIYICENAFTREDMIKMEMNVFKVVDFCLGIPLSYRFLRRFARCCKASMPTLTLARYILELSLMEYDMIFFSESKIASATLYMALKMNNVSGWTATLEYYSGYKLEEFMPIVLELNAMLHRKPKEQLKIIRNKYSHKIFFEVAKTPLLNDDELKCDSPTDNKENEKV